MLAERASGVIYVCLKESGNEQSKVNLADSILKTVLENMRVADKGKRRVFIILDEAWKLLGSSMALQTLLREGRKSPSRG